MYLVLLSISRYHCHMNDVSNQNGFTLLEILLVVGAIAILAGIVILALNPAKQLADTRNSERYSDIRTILDAVHEYSIDHDGNLPSGIDTSLRVLGTDSSGCNILCGGGDGSVYIEHDEQSDFDSGVYNQTQWDGTNSRVELTPAGRTSGSGTYTSEIFDAIDSTMWEQLSWVPREPYHKELPNNGVSESGYQTGNTSMSSNALLLHMNESSGLIYDDSGNGNNGTNNGAAYSVPGKFRTSLSFDGIDDYVNIPNSPSLNPSTSLTLEAWVKWAIDPPTGNSWAQIIDKNGDNQYQIQHNNSNTGFEFALRTTTGRVYLIGSTAPQQGVWYHVVATYDGSYMRLYVNGSQDAVRTHSGNIVSSGSNVAIGMRTSNDRHFAGVIDEVAVYDRALAPSEIADRYRRGALKLLFQIRSCDDGSCSGEAFIGPDGTSGTYYSEIDNATPFPPDLTFFGLSANRYLQYRMIFETDDASLSPTLSSISISSANFGGSPMTEASCLDLAPDLVSEYIVAIPQDPRNGSAEKTYYAVKQNSSGRVLVVSCTPELDEEIVLSR